MGESCIRARHYKCADLLILKASCQNPLGPLLQPLGTKPCSIKVNITWQNSTRVFTEITSSVYCFRLAIPLIEVTFSPNGKAAFHLGVSQYLGSAFKSS